jgi:two-component system NtrC family sensor kinase
MPRSSLRSELLFNLAFLAAAALLLALWTTSILQLAVLPASRFMVLVALLLLAELAVFLLLGNHLVNRLVIRPLAETAAVADAIAQGDYARRAPPGRTREIARLANALNRLTEQLLHNQALLAENVRSLDETNRQLNEAQRDLIQAEKMASLGRLSAGVAHEIGNPLGALVGYASVLRRRGVEPAVVDGVEREARRIDQIVRSLLDYARPALADREVVDVNASVGRVAELLRAQGRLADVELQLDLTPSLPGIHAVPHRVDQLFVNLFANAEAAMHGRGTLTVVTRAERYTPNRPVPPRRAGDPPGINYAHLRRTRYGAARDANQLVADREVVRVIVSDTGPGIPPESIESVFEPFFTTKGPREGTGLGLAIVVGTVEELGGRIEVSSAADGGASFHIFLPISQASE